MTEEGIADTGVSTARWNTSVALLINACSGDDGSPVAELGTIETPIILTNTLSVGTAMEALVAWTVAQEGNAAVQSVNPDFPHIAPSISGGEVGGAHLEERDDLLLQGIELRLEGLDPAVAGPEVVALQ